MSPGMVLAGLLSWLVLLPPGFAQDRPAQKDQAGSYLVEVGGAVEVTVGPHARLVVLDPDLVRVDEVGPQVINVTGLAAPGQAIVYVLGDGEPVTLVFIVQPAPPGPRAGPPLFPGVRPRVGETTEWMYRARGFLAGGPGVVAGTSHDLWIGRAFGATEVQGSLSVIGQTELGWDMPYVSLDVDRGAFGVGLGDRDVPFAAAIYLPRVRGAEVRWQPDRGRIGVVAGAGDTPACCPFVSRDGDLLGLAFGEVQVGAGATLGASGGVVYDRVARETLPLAQVGARYDWGASHAFGEGFLSGRGGGASGELDWEISRRVALLALARFVREGAYVRTGVRQPGDTMVANVLPTVRLSERWTVWGGVSSSYSERPAGPSGLSLGLQAGTQANLADRHTVQLGYHQGRRFEDPGDGFAPTSATHAVSLASSHRPSAHYRLFNQIYAAFREDSGPTGFRASHWSGWSWADGWAAGLTAYGSWQAGPHPGQLFLAGDLSARRYTLTALCRLGFSLALGPEGTVAAPLASAQVAWSFAPRHMLEVGGDGSYTVGTRAPAWAAHVQYTWTHGPAIGGRPLGIGAVRGVVFDDRDEDGLRDPGEAGIAGAIVTLDDGRTRTTDEGGEFRVPLVSAGPHELSVARNDLRSVDGTVREIDVRGLRASEVQYALTSGGRVLVRAFEDRDGDGAYSRADRVLRVARATVAVEGGQTLASRPLGSLAEIRGVPRGVHEVSVDLRDLPEGWAPADTLRRPVEVETASLRYVDLPVVALRSVSGRVWLDADRDGMRGPDDPFAADVPVRLDGHEVRTDAGGSFIFRRLPAGSYEVEVEGGLSRPPVDLRNGPKEILDLEILVAPPPAEP